MQSTNFAIFKTHRNALLAQHWLREKLGNDAKVTMVDRPGSRSHHEVPLSMTRVCRGAIAGGVGVAGVVALVLGATLVGFHTMPALSPVTTVGACMGLAAILGGLAGALSFSSDSNMPLRSLAGHHSRRQSIVLFPGPDVLRTELERFGAIRVGALG